MRKLIRSSHLIGDAARYALSGLGAAATDFGLYLLLHLTFDVTPALTNLVSRPLGGLVSFLLHKYFTFQNRGTAQTGTQFKRFWIVWALSFVISQGMVWWLSSIWPNHGVLAKLAAESAAVLCSFFCQRYWTFSAFPARQSPDNSV